MTLDLQSAIALSLLHSVWQIAALAVLAASSLTLLERRSAALRHTIGMAWLLSMALAPIATLVWLLRHPMQMAATLSADSGGSAMHADTLPSLTAAAAASAPSWLPLLWGAGVLAMLVRLVGGWWLVRGLDRQPFATLPAHWAQRADVLRRKLGIRRRVAIRLLQGVGLPCSAHAWRPVVWLPVSALTQLSPDQIEALIAHELAHIRRLDWIWNGLQCAIEALLFYHPGVWWLSRRIRQERENACDDLAVAVCGDAIVLAEALATLERHRMPAHALVLSSNGGALMKRITRLLSPEPISRPSPTLRWAVPVGIVAVVCSGALLATQLQRPIAPAAPVSMPAHPTTQIDISSDNQTFRISEATSLSGRRTYRSTVNAAGKKIESYTVNGEAQPINADTRRWIAHMIEGARDVPLPPPAPPAPAAPPAPPKPPQPPAPLPLTDTAAYRAAVSSAKQDPGVLKAVGSPVRVGAVVGYARLTDDRADLSFLVSGPQGGIRVRARGDLVAGAWDITGLTVHAP